jgi:hypothetical protein
VRKLLLMMLPLVLVYKGCTKRSITVHNMTAKCLEHSQSTIGLSPPG